MARELGGIVAGTSGSASAEVHANALHDRLFPNGPIANIEATLRQVGLDPGIRPVRLTRRFDSIRVLGPEPPVLDRLEQKFRAVVRVNTGICGSNGLSRDSRVCGGVDRREGRERRIMPNGARGRAAPLHSTYAVAPVFLGEWKTVVENELATRLTPVLPVALEDSILERQRAL